MTAPAEESTNPAARMGFEREQVVQEIGYDDDVDSELREGVEAATGQALVDEDYDGFADAVLLWFRDGDGDLTDALLDATGRIDDSAPVWLLTPKNGHEGSIEPSDIDDATKTAGLSTAKSIDLSSGWTTTRIWSRKGGKA
ncbi:DUF3052 domain-containing protein [Streptomyces sp. NPDC046261]|uniref:DUF3052 domain-containing protein n=1 Tax=Streptomyces sp. NPDC046261 TaxID=3157200 RepID=UPI0033D57700